MVYHQPRQQSYVDHPHHQQQVDNSRLYVSYVRPPANSMDLTEEHIAHFFSAAAPELDHVYKLKDRPIFFVKYRNAYAACEAMLRLNGFSLYGCVLRVVLADPPPPRGHQESRKPISAGGGGAESESKRRRDETAPVKEEERD
jgi:hypothetical protein